MVDMCKWQRLISRHNWSPCYRIAHGWNNWVYSSKYLEFNEANETEELFIIILFFFSIFFLFFSSFFLLRTVGNTMHLLHLPPCLNVCLSSSNEVMITWWSECTKLYQFSGLNFGIQGSISSWKIEANRGGKGLHFFGFFFCELFDASQAYVLLNFALDSTVLPSK